MPVKQLKIGSVGLTISLDDCLAERIRANVLYRFFVRPVVKYLDNRRSFLRNKESQIMPGEAISGTPRMSPTEITPEQHSLRTMMAETDWYHSIDLGHGVVTPGQFDHRPFLPLYNIPEDLSGKRVLDVATFDGFWAFEFEKRKASEVITMDIETTNDLDMPPRVREALSEEELHHKTGAGFGIAGKILGSKVQRKILNIYDLTPERMGTFDVVFCGDLLLHLMNPVKALQNIRSVVSEYAIIADCFDPDLKGDDKTTHVMRYAGGRKLCVWWFFSIDGLKQMILDAGFSQVEIMNTFEFGLQGSDEKLWHVVFKAYP